MGELNVKKLSAPSDRIEYIAQLVGDIEAMDRMLKEGKFEKAPLHVGAEQEFCLVNEIWNPSDKADEVLHELNDPHFTNELTRYNLEINLEPHLLEGTCFSELHKQLNELLLKAKEAAAKYGNKVILTGILPTIDTPFLGLDYMTPLKRYRVLNDAIKSIRKEDIELHIKGVDEVNLHHDTILYEGCNTSFQAHLQIDPDDFANTYNWAQAIAGPVLSVCTNSPLLLGKELWEETRIALFTQSVDTRASTFILNEKESRVGFGSHWICGSAADFFKDGIIQFRSLITTEFESDSLSQLDAGTIPKLKALNLHNGTIYKWNRVCYGLTDGKPHIRIENRYLPSGPTTDDEIANMMLWVGIMQGRPAEFDEIHKVMDFANIKSNFFNAARYGMAAQFYWNEELISSQDLLLNHLLPMAFRGLYSMGVAPRDVEHYLSIIERRIRTNNGSRWMIEAYRKLKRQHSVPDALKILVATMYQRKEKRYTVDAWQYPRGNEYIVPPETRVVRDFMTSRIFTAQEKDSAQLVLKMMEWKHIHHAPILDSNQDLTGLLTWTDVSHYLDEPEELKKSIKELMQTDLITVTADTSLAEAKSLMDSNNIHCLPVVSGTKLVGIITSNDI